MVNFAHASVKEAVGGPSLGELRPLIRTPNGGVIPAGSSLCSTPSSTGESKLPRQASFQHHYEVFRESSAYSERHQFR